MDYNTQVSHVPLPVDHRRLALLSHWQKGFPLVRAPFGVLAEQAGCTVAEVLEAYHSWQKSGELSRLGGIFDQTAGGASFLAAMAVPPRDLERVAAVISACPGVNHNYEREHHFNLWFVMTGSDADQIEAEMLELEAKTGCRAIRLPMVRPYRIDLAFDLHNATATHTASARVPPSERIAESDIALAALVEEGLPILAQPFDVWAEKLQLPVETVIAKIQHWLNVGVLRRFGNIVRHHELGFTANAMTVFDVPDAMVDDAGQALAAQPQVTLAYRRKRASGWNYNLYCMIHGRDRPSIEQLIVKTVSDCQLQAYPQAVLFSLRRFKQVGASRFRRTADAE